MDLMIIRKNCDSKVPWTVQCKRIYSYQTKTIVEAWWHVMRKRRRFKKKMTSEECISFSYSQFANHFVSIVENSSSIGVLMCNEEANL